MWKFKRFTGNESEESEDYVQYVSTEDNIPTKPSIHLSKCSIPALSFAFKDTHPLRRLAWSVLFIVGAGAFIWLVTLTRDLQTDYYSRTFITRDTQVSFPKISICEIEVVDNERIMENITKVKDLNRKDWVASCSVETNFSEEMPCQENQVEIYHSQACTVFEVHLPYARKLKLMFEFDQNTTLEEHGLTVSIHDEKVTHYSAVSEVSIPKGYQTKIQVGTVEIVNLPAPFSNCTNEKIHSFCFKNSGANNCPVDCHMRKYKTDFSHARIKLPFDTPSISLNTTGLEISLSDEVETREQIAKYSPARLAGIIGGLSRLLVGASVISLLELVYIAIYNIRNKCTKQ